MVRKYWVPEIETAPREKLRRLQEDELKALVGRVYQKVPLYRRKFDEAGLKPDDIKTLEDITKIPLTNAVDDIREIAPDERLAVSRDKIITIESTSGTTGPPKLIMLTEKDVRGWEEIMARFSIMHGIGEGDVFLLLATLAMAVPGYQKAGAIVIPGDWSTGFVDNQINYISTGLVTAMFASPTLFLRLIARADELGISIKGTKLHTVTVGGESWSEAYRNRMESEYKINFREIYGMLETGDFACECSARQGLHIFDDMVIAEIVDPDTDKVLPAGELGELIITTLWIEGMPLLRYRTGDIARILKYEPCSCGRTFSRISRIKGRTSHMVKVGEAKIFPIDVEEVIQATPELWGEYQIIVEKPGTLDTLKIRAECKPESRQTTELRQKVESELEKVTSVKVEVELLPYGELPRAAIKTQRIIHTYK